MGSEPVDPAELADAVTGLPCPVAGSAGPMAIAEVLLARFDVLPKGGADEIVALREREARILALCDKWGPTFGDVPAEEIRDVLAERSVVADTPAENRRQLIEELVDECPGCGHPDTEHTLHGDRTHCWHHGCVCRARVAVSEEHTDG